MPATINTKTVIRTTITLGEQRAELDDATDAQIVNMTNIVVKMHELTGGEVDGLKVVKELVEVPVYQYRVVRGYGSRSVAGLALDIDETVG